MCRYPYSHASMEHGSAAKGGNATVAHNFLIIITIVQEAILEKQSITMADNNPGINNNNNELTKFGDRILALMGLQGVEPERQPDRWDFRAAQFFQRVVLPWSRHVVQMIDREIFLDGANHVLLRIFIVGQHVLAQQNAPALQNAPAHEAPPIFDFRQLLAFLKAVMNALRQHLPWIIVALMLCIVGRVAHLETKVARIPELEAKAALIPGLKADVAVIPGLKADVAELEAKAALIPGLKAEVAVIPGLKAEVAVIPGLKADVAGLEAKAAVIPGLEAKVTSLKGQLDHCQNKRQFIKRAFKGVSSTVKKSKFW